VDGTLQATRDYTVDIRDGEIEYNGSDSGAATVSYKYADIANSVVQEAIDSATAEIDDELDTTFNGLKTVTNEYYNGQGETDVTYVFDKRPVARVDAVARNENTPSESPSYVDMTQGLGEDYVKDSSAGVRFINSQNYPKDAPRELRVSYAYGYDTLPADINELCKIMVLKSLFKDRVHGAGIDGRDNFDPQTVDSYSMEIDKIMDRWRLNRFDNFTELAEEGLISG
jgi:hypothetical protein